MRFSFITGSWGGEGERAFRDSGAESVKSVKHDSPVHLSLSPSLRLPPIFPPTTLLSSLSFSQDFSPQESLSVVDVNLKLARIILRILVVVVVVDVFPTQVVAARCLTSVLWTLQDVWSSLVIGFFFFFFFWWYMLGKRILFLEPN